MIGLALLFAQAAGAAPAFEDPQVPDPVLAEQRGGVRLPNGIDLALTVQTQTAVNGSVVLQTVFKLDEGAPNFTVYAPPDNRTVTAPQASGEGNGAVTVIPPTVIYDSRSGLQVTRGTTMPPLSISTSAPQGTSTVPEGLEQIDPGAGVQTDNGKLTAAAQNGVRSIELTAPDFSVVHFAGNAFGSAIANTGNDRAINSETTISIDLSNAGPDVLGSTMLRVEDVALGALSSRM
jgi:hypothetical protein